MYFGIMAVEMVRIDLFKYILKLESIGVAAGLNLGENSPA